MIVYTCNNCEKREPARHDGIHYTVPLGWWVEKYKTEKYRAKPFYREGRHACCGGCAQVLAEERKTYSSGGRWWHVTHGRVNGVESSYDGSPRVPKDEWRPKTPKEVAEEESPADDPQLQYLLALQKRQERVEREKIKVEEHKMSQN